MLTSQVAPVLAHAGGAPEAVAVVVPLLLVAGFVIKERRNMSRLQEAERAADEARAAMDDPDGPPRLT